MKKIIFVAAAFIAITVSACTKSTVTPTKEKINLSIGGKDTISNQSQAAARLVGGKK